ncbi:helix-turn-helix transcriptional regulator [Mesorhizobium amorphae]|uniref:helix-turn-helix transcriptional regulator n=1 Tax=Mesorhizobium amorphae TaxID=71433 RepID=UPI003D66D26C
MFEFNGGGTLRAIAERLGVSHSTVLTHLKSIFAKTGVSKQRDLLVLLNRRNVF